MKWAEWKRKRQTKNARLQFSPFSRVSSRCCLFIQRGSHLDVDILKKKRQLQRVTEKSTGCEPLISSSRGIVDPSRRFLASELVKVRQERKKTDSWAVNLRSFPLLTHCLTCAQVMATASKRRYWKWSDISKGVPSPCDPDWSSAETKVGKPPSKMEGRLKTWLNWKAKKIWRAWCHMWWICQERH